MPTEELVMFVTNDLSGTTRGKSFPLTDLEERMTKGVGWVPANQALNPFSAISGDNPFGPTGDLRLLPIADTKVRIDGIDGASPLHLFLCDIVETDGTPWECCTRLFLKRALADLEAETGLKLLAAFEHEFTLLGAGGPVAPAFSIASLRQVDGFAIKLVEALRATGVSLEYLLPEYGPRQYEVVCRPTAGVTSADQAIVIREATREVARSSGLAASFAPKSRPQGVGNGVHVHFSLLDQTGLPVIPASDPDQPVSPIAGQFVAGILAHLPALCALTAPSIVSYLRLAPHHWSAAYTCFGVRNREASVRLCPVLEFSGLDRAAQANLEFRAADAAASPYMVLGAIVRAGLDWIRRRLPTPLPINTDPDALSEAERKRLGVERLPISLPDALAALEADTVVSGWLPAAMRQTYFSMKRSEIADCTGLSPDELCAKYSQVY